MSDPRIPEHGPHGPQPPQPYPQPQPYYAPPPRRLGWLWVLLALATPVLLFGCMCLMFASAAASLGQVESSTRVQEKRYKPYRYKGNQKIAIIHVQGTILDGKSVIRQAEKVIRDKSVRAVVVRINSPGGTIAGSDAILQALKEMRHSREDEPLPLVVSMGALAASGGYYVAMAVEDTPQSIYAEPTTWTGSIGVIIPRYNMAQLADKIGVKEDSIVSHPLKKMGDFFSDLTPEERKILQGLVDEAFAQFKKVVLSGRPQLKPQELDKAATGQIYSTSQAIQLKLVDREGYLDDAIARAAELAGLSTDDIYVVEYRAPFGLLELLGSQTAQKPDPLAQLLESTTPRAWYLCTWLPGVATGSVTGRTAP